jgi:hypothetical protein
MVRPAAHFVLVDEKLFDLVHERWRQVIKVAHFGLETRTNRNGNHPVIADSFPLLHLFGFNQSDQPRLHQT